MTHRNSNKPLYYSTYSFIAQINGNKMEFVSEKEYEEYIQTPQPISIIKECRSEVKRASMKVRIVLYRRTSDDMYFVYKSLQFFNNQPHKDVYLFKDYCEAFKKYKEIGGN